MFEIDSRIDAIYDKSKRVYPCRSNRASSIGHPCTRYLTYMRKDWEKKTLPDTDLLYIFEGGKYIEDLVADRFKKARLIISQQQRDFEDKKTGITGHIDGYVATGEEPNKTYPLEIKGMSPFIWAKIDTVEDMINSDKVWVRGYPGQLQIYMYLAEKEYGCFYLVNKLTLRGKTIWMKLDYGYAEGLLKKAEEINSYLDKEGEYPDRIPYDPDVCQRCDFRHICVPEEHFQSQVDILEDKKLEEMLDRRGEVKENRFEYERLDKEIKAIGKEMEKDNLLIGNWIISRKTSIGKRKPSPGGTYTISRIKIQKMEDK